MASEEEEIAALDRVLTRTVLTKDEDLQQVKMGTRCVDAPHPGRGLRQRRP